MTSIGETRASTKQAESDEIERKTREFLKSGGKIKEQGMRPTKNVDLHFRHYGQAAMEDAK